MHHRKTGRACQIRLAFQDLYQQTSATRATGFFEKWYSGPPIAARPR